MNKKLVALLDHPKFQAIAEEVANLRGVTVSVISLYARYPRWIHKTGNDLTIVIREKDHSPEEVATLIEFFKLQDGWPNSLSWSVLRKGDRESW